MSFALFGLTLALAFANGANDIFKGVATLLGSGAMSYRRALAWALGATLLGALAALALPQDLMIGFTGAKLVGAAAATPQFVASAALGAVITILAATALGLPTSTTHALTGGLVGAGLVSVGAGHVRFDVLLSSFVVPLALSPLLAVALGGASRLVSRQSPPGGSADCLCVAELAPASTPFSGRALTFVQGSGADCERHGARALVTTSALRDAAHVLSASSVSLARGLNDTPKIAALAVATGALPTNEALLSVALAMTLGGMIAAARVARTMSFGITGLDARSGLGANLATAGLVLAASPLGLPVSTTHVSCGALIGSGAASGQARWATIGRVAGAWVLTLPAAGLLAAVAALIL
jgi:PiT family inorganic phosphate transporter